MKAFSLFMSRAGTCAVLIRLFSLIRSSLLLSCAPFDCPRIETALLVTLVATNDSHDTFGCQFTNAPLGLSFHAQTCSV